MTSIDNMLGHRDGSWCPAPAAELAALGHCEAFGFRGTHLVAGSVREARAILADVAKHGYIDLVISDMQLDDGTGLDVIRYVRSLPARAHVPVLILSGNIDPATVNRAYALGANAYVHKAVLARSFAQVLESLHDHWLHDVRLPAPSRGRTYTTVAREVSLHTHAAQSDLSVAEHLGVSAPVSSLWVTMSLREGNLANLLAFLLSQLGERELPAEFLDEIERLQAHAERTLAALDGAPVHEPDEGLRHMLAFVLRTDAAPFSRASATFFPRRRSRSRRCSTLQPPAWRNSRCGSRLTRALQIFSPRSRSCDPELRSCVR